MYFFSFTATINTRDFIHAVLTKKVKVELIFRSSLSEADSGLVKLVVMTNVFFNSQQHEIKTKRFIDR